MNKSCIVIPCYNEAKRIELHHFYDFIEREELFDFCFVNDGSRDNTAEVLREATRQHPGRLLLVDNADNRGKAEAVRSGVLHVASLQHYDTIGFLDADLATPLEELYLLAGVMNQHPEAIMTIGCRLKRLGATVQRKAYRHYMGRVFATVVSVLYNLPVYDTQCGAKLFKATIITTAFGTPFFSPWFFDVEMLLRIQKHYPDYTGRVHEVPLNTWIEKGDSRIKFSHLLKLPKELYVIYRHYRS